MEKLARIGRDSYAVEGVKSGRYSRVSLPVDAEIREADRVQILAAHRAGLYRLRRGDIVLRKRPER